MKITVLLWSTSVEKDSNIVPSLFFSHFFGPSLFYGLSLFFLFLTWDNALENDDHHTSIYLQLNDYNSILEKSMTLYDNALEFFLLISSNWNQYFITFWWFLTIIFVNRKFLEFSARSNNYHPRRSYRFNLAQTLIKT